MTKIKLCGMKRAADIQAANRLKPDYIGFVFAAKSKRYVTPEQAAGLKSILDPDISAVGVFVDDKKSGRYLGAQHFAGMSLEDAVAKAEREFDSPYKK